MRLAWAILAGMTVLWLVKSAAEEMCQEEMRTRLARLPGVVLRLAVLRLPQEVRDDVAEEWQAELNFVLSETDGLPLTRLFRGARYALSLLWASGSVARELWSCEKEEDPSPDVAAVILAVNFDPLAEAALARAEQVGYRGPAACAVAGITYRQLDYWARTGLVEPTLRAHYSSARFYCLHDIVTLKVVKRLLEAGISLHQIRGAAAHLRDRCADDLARVTLMSDGKNVYECTTADEVVGLLQGGQGVFGVAINRIQREVESSLAELPGEFIIREHGSSQGGRPGEDDR